MKEIEETKPSTSSSGRLLLVITDLRYMLLYATCCFVKYTVLVLALP